ncbi:hypothetical protein IG616_00060 [Labrenzia suaedae]|uniref:Uncharacterized protein n=2 Tax=Roseibium litorale TaxID=2803841 RepID=A0ABR9CG70_9HYPH|nr:hypothetical protein [Roseibium litorale]
MAFSKTTLDHAPQKTVVLDEDKLAVTVSAASESQTDPLDSEMTIWVGEVQIQGRNTVWVELIDSYGEVVYESEVGTNETHLLPDGRAVVVRDLHSDTNVAKLDTSRVISDTPMLVTRRVVESPETSASVEFVEAAPAPKQDKHSPMLNIASVGQVIWANIVAFFDAAATRIQVAWNWIKDTLPA